MQSLERDEILSKSAVAMVAHLPQHIAQRELKVDRNSLVIDPVHLEIRYLSSAYEQDNAVCEEAKYIWPKILSFVSRLGRLRVGFLARGKMT